MPTIPKGVKGSLQALNQAHICRCFNDLFGVSHRVRMQGGGSEPDYVPATDNRYSLIVAREDFAASALHEAAHWCVASEHRRNLADYGYSYHPPPRGESGQIAFLKSELRVQAVECYLASRAGLQFRASADDPDYPLQALAAFQNRLEALVKRWENSADPASAPPRAQQLAAALERCLDSFSAVVPVAAVTAPESR